MNQVNETSQEKHSRLTREAMVKLSQILNEMEQSSLHGKFGVIMVAKEGKVFEFEPISLPTFR